MGFDQYIQRVMSGAECGVRAGALRGALALAEPVYAAAAAARNRKYDRDASRVHTLGRPTISVGNITTGGTGKTPVVRWLAEKLREEGRRVAILSRGYKAKPGSLGDEQRMLDGLLNGGRAGALSVLLRADPDRLAAAAAVLAEHPEVDVFLLDDAFQHRRAARDLDVVLVNAAEPFGHGHVLPRGLLREPLGGLRRAGAVVLTHALAVGDEERGRIVDVILAHDAEAPVYACVHEPVCFRASDGTNHPLEAMRGRRPFAFSGLGNPVGFEREVERLAGRAVATRQFADHHAYVAGDLAAVREQARAVGADLLVTTEKDWVKLKDLSGAADGALPVWRLDVAARFLADDAGRLVEQVRAAIQESRAARTA